jgi:hypothetical protein
VTESAIAESDASFRKPVSAGTVHLPHPSNLPSDREALAAALRDLGIDRSLFETFADSAARAQLRQHLLGVAAERLITESALPLQAPPARQVEREHQEHDDYFGVVRPEGDGAVGFVSGLVLVHLAAYEDALRMGLTLIDAAAWRELWGGLRAVLAYVDGPGRSGGSFIDLTAEPPPPATSGWADGYDPARRWLVGHQLFFGLIHGAVVGLNWFSAAAGQGSDAEASRGLAMAAAFLRSSASAMKFTSDFSAEDYEATVRPAMAPPVVRAGFSGLQTRDHAHLVRLFGSLTPVLRSGAAGEGHPEFVEALASAYAAHEFICARFRGDVLPSLRMAAASGGRTRRTGVEVIRELMHARLALIDPLTETERK